MPNPRGNKRKYNRQRHEFLLTFFPQEEDHYEYKEVNGYWLVKQYNANTHNWEVAIYSQSSFAQSQNYLKENRDREPNAPVPA